MVRGRVGVEERQRQGLPVEREAMQVEIVVELALDAPEPILGTVRQFFLFHRARPVEAAAEQGREFDVGRVGTIGPGVTREAEPEVKIYTEAGACHVETR